MGSAAHATKIAQSNEGYPADDSLDRRALAGGWLLSDAFQEQFQLLAKRVLLQGMTSADEKVVIAAFRAISAAVARQQIIEGNAARTGLPSQISGENVQVNIGLDGDSDALPEGRPISSIVDEKLSRESVQEAINEGLPVADYDVK